MGQTEENPKSKSVQPESQNRWNTLKVPNITFFQSVFSKSVTLHGPEVLLVGEDQLPLRALLGERQSRLGDLPGGRGRLQEAGV